MNTIQTAWSGFYNFGHFFKHFVVLFAQHNIYAPISRQLSTVSYKTPVVIVPGANHSQVASGKMPLNVELNDLIADNTEAETHQILAAVTNAFMVVNGPQLVKIARMQAAAVIGKQYLSTKNIITVSCRV